MEAYIGQIIPVGFDFAPEGWALCNGQLFPISYNTALFSVIGTRFGGDGRTTFALPDLRGRAVMGAGSGPGLTPREVGQATGSETVTLSVPEMPAHQHALMGTETAASPAVGQQASLAASAGDAPPAYGTGAGKTVGSTLPAGAGAAHENRQPFAVVNYIICLRGIYPPRP